MKELHRGKVVGFFVAIAAALAIVTWAFLSHTNGVNAATENKQEPKKEKEVEVKILEKGETDNGEAPESKDDFIVTPRSSGDANIDARMKEFEALQREINERMKSMREDQEKMMREFFGKDWDKDLGMPKRDDWDISPRFRNFQRFPDFDLDLEPFPGGTGTMPGMRKFSTAIDMSEHGDKIVIKCDMPGMEKGNIEVTLKGRQLTISGTRKASEEKKQDDDNGRVIVQERSSGSFTRILTLPQNIDPDGITSRYENGVLEITVPKTTAEEPEEKNIIIESK